MTSGCFVSVRINRRKAGSTAQVSLKTGEGHKTESVPLSMRFCIEALDSRAREHLASRFPAAEKYLHGRLARLYQACADNAYFRAEKIREIRHMPGRKKIRGAKQALEKYFLLHMRPYDFYSAESGKVAKAAGCEQTQQNLMAFDIETSGLVDAKKDPAGTELKRIGIAADDGYAAVLKGGTKDVLENFFPVRCRYGIGVGWNSDDFDNPVLHALAEKHGVDPGLDIRKQRMGSRKAVAVFRPFGIQNIDLKDFVPRVYGLPTAKLDDARRVLLGTEPVYINKSEMDSLTEEELDTLVMGDAQDLLQVCLATGFKEAVTELSGKMRLFPDMLTRMSFTDLAARYVEVLYRCNKGEPDDGRPAVVPSNMLPFEGAARYKLDRFRMPPARGSPGHYKNAYKIDKSMLYLRHLTANRRAFESAGKAPVSRAAEGLCNSIKENASDGGPGKETTVSRVLKQMGSRLAVLLMDRKYGLADRYLAGAALREADRVQGCWNDWEQFFTDYVPDIMEKGVEERDVEKLDGLIVFEGGYAFAKDGLAYWRGINLRGMPRYAEDAARACLHAAAVYGKDGLVDEFRRRADPKRMAEEAEKLTVRHRGRFRRKAEQLRQTGYDAGSTVRMSYSDCATLIAGRLEPAAYVFGMDAGSLLHAAQPRQLSLI